MGEERFDTLFPDEGSARKGKEGSRGFGGVVRMKTYIVQIYISSQSLSLSVECRGFTYRKT